jgi:beta-glucosidase
VGGIVEFWLTGQAHGDSIVDVLTGGVDPAGRLAETIPVRLEDTPAFLDFPGDVGHVRYAEGIHVGYRWYDARKLDVDYPFGHGLSYTTFDYSDLQVEVGDMENPVAFTATLTLSNTGTRHGSEVVQLYVTDRSGFLQMPEKELRAFAKVTLEAGQSRKVTLSVRRSDLEHFHLRAGWTFPGGELDILIGSSSRDIRLRHSAHVRGHQVSTPLTIWSPYRDWLDHPIAGPAITAVIERNGGVTGRKADQLSDPVARKSTLSNPVAVLCMFPGFPVSDAEAQAILDRL